MEGLLLPAAAAGRDLDGASCDDGPVERRVAWLVTLPLAAAGVLAAHQAAYRLTGAPAAEGGGHAHEGAARLADVHGYLAAVPAALVVGAALVLTGLVLRARLGAGRAGGSAGAYALVAPGAYALQEHLERLAHSGEIPAGAVLEPTFGIGLLLTLPFALVAYLLARLLLGAAGRIGAALRGRPAAAVAAAAARRPLRAAPADRSRRPVLGTGRASRAPPLRG
jgi:hypothetical protein